MAKKKKKLQQNSAYKKIILKITQRMNSNSRQKDLKHQEESMKSAISDLKNNHLKSEIEANFNKLSNIPLYKQYMLGTSFPREYKDLETKKYTYLGNLDREIWWTILMVKKYKSEINIFLQKHLNSIIFLRIIQLNLI